jgi:uncharacterized cupin superfamily protein
VEENPMFDAGKTISIVAPDGGEAINVLGAAMIVKSESGALVAEHIVPPGYFVPPHSHDHDDEMFFMLDGRLTLLDGAREIAIGPGETAKFERGALHGFRNDTDGDVRFLVVCTPGVRAAEMFRHFDRAARNAPLTPDALVGICAQYGVRI